MALEKCNAEIVKALGRELTKREQGTVARRATELKKKIDLANNDPAAVTGILQDFADEAAARASIAKRTTALNYAAFAKQKAWHETVEPVVKNPGEVLMASVRGSLRNFQGAKDSAANLAQHEMNARSYALTADLLKAKVADYAFAPESNQAVGGALYDMRNGSSEAAVSSKYGPQAAKAASVLEDHRERLRQALNSAGAFIGKNSDAIFRRSHDAGKIAKAGGNTYGSPEAKASWVQNVNQKMDWTKAFDGELANAPDKERQSVLESLWTQFSAGTHLPASTSDAMGTGTRNLGKKFSHQRQLVFKSAQDEVAYLNEFGHGNSIGEIVRYEMQSGGKDLALMRKFGPNPEATFDKIYNDRKAALTAAGDAKGLAQLDKSYRNLKDNDWKLLTGATGHPTDNFISRFLSAGRTWTNAAAIGNSIWALTGDTSLRASMIAQRTAGTGVSKSIFDGYMRNFSGHGLSTEEAAALAAEAGIRFEGITAPIDPYSGESITQGLASKAMKLTLRFGMHNGWVNRERINNLVADSNHYWAMRDKATADMHPMERGTLAQFGIGAKEWDILRQQKARDIKDGQMGFTPQAILDMPTDAFKSLIPDGGTETQLVKARQALHDSFRNLLGEYADRATVSPSLANQAFMQLGRTPAGTVPGELWRSALQLKGFVMNYMRNHMGRELYGYSSEYRSFPQAMADMMRGQNPSAAKGLSKLMVAGALNFYVVNALKDLALGKTPQDPFDFDIEKHGSLWDTPGFQAFSKAWAKQSFGIYGDVLMGDSRPGESVLETIPKKFIGPEGELVGNVADSAFAYMHAMGKRGGPSDKDLGKASQQLFGTAWKQAPGTQMWFAKGALDHYVYNELADAMNPGYKKRVEDRMRKRGQTYLMGN